MKNVLLEIPHNTFFLGFLRFLENDIDVLFITTKSVISSKSVIDLSSY